MARPNKADPAARKSLPPATTMQGREDQLVNLALDVVEKQMLDGTASSQTLAHWLKLGSSRHRKEMQKMQVELDLANAKIRQMESASQGDEKLERALKAFRNYSGQEEDEEYDA